MSEWVGIILVANKRTIKNYNLKRRLAISPFLVSGEILVSGVSE